MKKFFAFMLGMGLAALPAPAQELMSRIHFAGVEQISARTRMPPRSPMSFAPPKPARWRRRRWIKFPACRSLRRSRVSIPGETNDQSGQIRPLLDDLLRAEWLFDAREATNGSPEYALAVRLSR